MIRDIIRDPIVLAQKSKPAGEADRNIAADLSETLEANRERCVGMAANMIGELKRIIVFDDNGRTVVMFNPEIIKKSGEYDAEEGCLSLDGVRKTKRYKNIKVSYQNEMMQNRIK